MAGGGRQKHIIFGWLCGGPVYGRIILKRILEFIGCENENCIHLAQDRNQWWCLVNTVMSLTALQEAGNFLAS
jgi:hypothetical protein